MQRMSRSRDQWQLNAHRLDCFNHVNHVSTRSNGQESLRSRTRSSTHVDFEISFFFFSKRWIFDESSTDNFCFTPLFLFNVLFLPEKFKNILKAPIFSRKIFLKGIFLVGQTEKNEITRKKQNRKRNKEKHNERKQKFKRQLKNRKDFSSKRKENQER